MLLSIHVLTGAVISLAVQQPLVSAPVAFATHLLLDAVPHWNYPVPRKRTLSSFWEAFGPDLIGTFAVLALVVLVYPSNWYFALWGACWAACPDFLTLFQKQKPWSQWFQWYFKLHNRVQWEVARGPGLAVQAFFTLILLIALAGLQLC